MTTFEEHKQVFYKNLIAFLIFFIIILVYSVISQLAFKPLDYNSIEGCGRNSVDALKSIKECQDIVKAKNQDNTINTIIFTITLTLILISINILLEKDILKYPIIVGSIFSSYLLIINQISPIKLELLATIIALIVLFYLNIRKGQYENAWWNIIITTGIITIFLLILTNIGSQHLTFELNLKLLPCKVNIC